MLTYSQMQRFVIESNDIEGVRYEPSWPATWRAVERLKTLVETDDLNVSEVAAFVAQEANGARLRLHPEMNVRVGRHIPPQGGDHIGSRLADLLEQIDSLSPYEFYCAYETLHPFMDGNGRSGRALWLRCCLQTPTWSGLAANAGFLKTFHYQALDACDQRN